MPQQQPAQDAEALQELGRASVEIVHDIKNQLNGLKLYATFLRKRFERDTRPADELETINKIIAGLERAAAEPELPADIPVAPSSCAAPRTQTSCRSFATRRATQRRLRHGAKIFKARSTRRNSARR